MATTTEKKTKKETVVSIPGGETAGTARARTKDGASVTYPVTITEKDVEDNDNDIQEVFDLDELGLTDLPFIEEQDSPQIPKTQLEKMFDRIRDAVATDKIDDSFFASVVRMPDPINSRYAKPCATQLELGVFPFSSIDQFNFRNGIYQVSGNSGGLFNVTIYKSNLDALTLYRRLPTGQTSAVSVGLVNFGVIDPPQDVTQPNNTPQNGYNPNDPFTRYMEKSDEKFERLFTEINKPKEPSALERAMEQKLINDMISPPPPAANPMVGMMEALAASHVFVDRLTNTMMPIPPAPAEPDTWEKITKLIDTGTGQMVAGRIGDIIEHITVANLPVNKNPGANDAADDDEEPTEMQDLLETVVTELETDNALDANNAVIKDLRTKYVSHFEDLQTMCQSMQFDAILSFLMAKGLKMQPSPVIDFLDVDETKKRGQYVWTEQGERLKTRLTEFYTFLQTA